MTRTKYLLFHLPAFLILNGSYLLYRFGLPSFSAYLGTFAFYVPLIGIALSLLGFVYISYYRLIDIGWAKWLIIFAILPYCSVFFWILLITVPTKDAK